MSAPGSSVFQGAGSLIIDNATQRQEEEEFLAEEQTRKAELATVMKTAFGDLEDDDDVSSIASSVVSSRCNYRPQHHSDGEVSRSSSYGRSFHENGNRHCIQENFTPGRLYGGNDIQTNGSGDRCSYNSPPENSSGAYHNVEVDFHVVSETYKKSDVNSLEQIKILYDVRMREIETLRKEINAEQRSKDQVLRKLVVSETEKNEMAKTLSECRSVLLDTGQKVKELERERIAVEEELNRVRKEKEETKQELDIAKFQILQMEQQITLLERCGAMKNPDKHIDGIVEALAEKHKREMNLLKKELNDTLMKVKEKDEQNKALESRLGEVERNHNATLLDKCDATVRQEIAIKALLDDAVTEKIQLSKKIHVLEAEITTLRNDLELYENISNNRLLSSTSSGEVDDQDLSPSNFRRTGERKSASKIDILKSELNRAVLGQKEKRLEIRRLQEQVQSKEVQIAQMREQEKSYLTEIERLKTVAADFQDRVARSNDQTEFKEKITCLEQLISVIDKEKAEKTAQVAELKAEVEKWKKAIEEHESSARAIAEQYTAYHEQEIKRLKLEHEESTKANELEWRISMERVLEECDEIKKLYLEMRSARDTSVEKLEAEKQKLAELARTNRVLEEKIASLKQKVADLEELVLKVEQEKADMRRQPKHQRLSDCSGKKSRDADTNRSHSHCDQVDFEKLRDEVCAAKKRYIELETTLKTEFESNVNALREENENLKTQLRNYEKRLEEVRETATQTALDHAILIADDPDKRLEEFDKLQSELERLRTLEIIRCKEIMELKASFQKRLHEKIDELESKLMPSSQDDVETVKEQVKSATSQYFLDEIAKIREAHKIEIESLEANKVEEIHRLESELKLKSNEAQTVENLKAQLVEQQRNLENVKTRTGQMVTSIAREFEELKAEKEELVRKLEAISVKSEKYKQTAHRYKNLFEKLKTNDLPQRYQRLVALVESKESEIISRIQEVTDAFQAQQEIRSQQS